VSVGRFARPPRLTAPLAFAIAGAAFVWLLGAPSPLPLALYGLTMHVRQFFWFDAFTVPLECAALGAALTWRRWNHPWFALWFGAAGSGVIHGAMTAMCATADSGRWEPPAYGMVAHAAAGVALVPALAPILYATKLRERFRPSSLLAAADARRPWLVVTAIVAGVAGARACKVFVVTNAECAVLALSLVALATFIVLDWRALVLATKPPRAGKTVDLGVGAQADVITRPPVDAYRDAGGVAGIVVGDRPRARRALSAWIALELVAVAIVAPLVAIAPSNVRQRSEIERAWFTHKPTINVHRPALRPCPSTRIAPSPSAHAAREP
jgi:hypothetical protein